MAVETAQNECKDAKGQPMVEGVQSQFVVEKIQVEDGKKEETTSIDIIADDFSQEILTNNEPI